MQTTTETAVKGGNVYQNRILTVPNILSFFRLGLIPVICLVYFLLDNGVLTGIIVGVSALTDVVDGFIARRCNMISDFGKALDPIADKLTQGIVLLCVASRFPHLLILAGLLLVKEVITGAVNLHVVKKTGVVHGAEWHGKLTTVMIFVVMVVHLMWSGVTPTVSYILCSVCAVVMLMSFVLYGVQNQRYLKSFNKQ